MSSNVRNLPEGYKIAGYSVRSKLGSGGMGDVYLCDDASLGRLVALKVMHAFDSTDAEAASRFVLEGKALAKLTHPSIVSVYGLGEDAGHLYIAMELVQGKSLFQQSRDRKLSLSEMISIFADVAAGLDHAHSHGIVHRDIKPANILVDSFGRGKIIDFGIAKAVGASGIGAEGVKTKTGTVIGTLNYIAPELFRGDPPSPSSDIYALGLCFFEMLTGRTPFKGESQFSTMEKIRAGEIDIPENLRIILPDEFWDVLYSMIDPEPSNRAQTATSAALKLKQISLPELPKTWGAHLSSVRIDNIEELQDQLEAEGIDQAEWQFILSTALKAHSERPAHSADDESESTSLIETTGVILLKETLQEAIVNYRHDLQSILTTRRAERVSSLTPPPKLPSMPGAPVAGAPAPTGAHIPGTFGPQTASHMGHTGPHQMTGSFSVQTSSYPGQQESSSSPMVKWISAVAIIAVGIVGFSQYKRWQKDVATQIELEVTKRQIEERNSKPVRGRGEKVLAPVSKGFAMIVEPSQDAWTPIALALPDMGQTTGWKWKMKSADGHDITFEESRTVEAVEDGLLKVRVTLTGGNQFGNEWYQPGFFGVPRKTGGSAIFGSLGGTIVGQPEAIFPLRKGKEVHFEMELQQAQGAKPSALAGVSPTGVARKLRGSCVVGDKSQMNLAFGTTEVVRTECSFKGEKFEFVFATSWSEKFKAVVKHEFRTINTDGDAYLVHSVVGEMVSVGTPAVVESRLPTSQPQRN